jgi:hypothetical protein
LDREGYAGVTTRTDFAHDEWDRLVQLPRWVVAAASAAQWDGAHKTRVEVESGLIASAHGRGAGNAFVAEVGEETLKIFDERATVAAIDFTKARAGINAVLDQVAQAKQVLAAKADPVDAAAYQHWLLAITDVVIRAARTGDFMGFGGQLVTEKEHQFRDRLAQVLEG